MTAIDRRTLFRATGIVGLGVGLSACGGGSTEPGGNAAASDAPAGDAPARSITHKYGTTEISGTPQRVVTVGLTGQDYLLALGVVPVGTTEWFGEQPGALFPWALDELGDGELSTVLPIAEINFEGVAALMPDLILGVNSGLSQAEYDRLAQIAPTVTQPLDYADFGAPWQVYAETIAMTVGADISEQVTYVEGQFEQVRSDNPEFEGRTALLAAQLADGTYYIYADGPAPTFLRDLGFALPGPAEELLDSQDRAPTLLSEEQLSLMEADVLVMGVYGEDVNAPLADPTFANLTIVEQGRVILLSELSAADASMTFGTVLSLPTALEEMVPRISTALDGDPATMVESAI